MSYDFLPLVANVVSSVRCIPPVISMRRRATSRSSRAWTTNASEVSLFAVAVSSVTTGALMSAAKPFGGFAVMSLHPHAAAASATAWRAVRSGTFLGRTRAVSRGCSAPRRSHGSRLALVEDLRRHEDEEVALLLLRRDL